MRFLICCIALLFVSTANGQSNCYEITTIPDLGAEQSTGCLLVRSRGYQVDDTALLRYAISLSASQNRKLFLKGHFWISATVAVYGNADITGINGASIRNLDPVDVLLLIKKDASDIRIEDVDLFESELIDGAVISFAGRNKNVTLKRVNIDGRLVTDGRNTVAIQSGVDWLENLQIRDCNITEFQSGIFISTPVWGLVINGCCFTQWTDFGVYIGQRSGFSRRTRDIWVVDNFWHNPAEGIISQPLMIVKGAATLPVKTVSVVDNRVFGGHGAYVRGELNRAQGDMVVLQGVTTFVVRNNRIKYGGENGLTVSRLSKQGVIADNVIFENDQNGINIGSGSFDLIVDRPENFEAGDAIIGTQSGAQAVVRFKDFDGTLVLDQAGISPFFAEVIANATSGNPNAALSQTMERTKSILIRDNRIYDNGLDVNDETVSSHGCFVFNSDHIQFLRNRFFDNNFPNGTQTWAVRCNNSRSMCFNDNIWQWGQETFDDAVFLNLSTWLDPDNCGFGVPD